MSWMKDVFNYLSKPKEHNFFDDLVFGSPKPVHKPVNKPPPTNLDEAIEAVKEDQIKAPTLPPPALPLPEPTKDDLEEQLGQSPSSWLNPYGFNEQQEAVIQPIIELKPTPQNIKDLTSLGHHVSIETLLNDIRKGSQLKPYKITSQLPKDKTIFEEIKQKPKLKKPKVVSVNKKSETNLLKSNKKFNRLSELHEIHDEWDDEGFGKRRKRKPLLCKF